MEKLAKNKRLFIALSCASITCLTGSFAYPLQKLQVYRQVEKNALGQSYTRNFILTESDVTLPWGFDFKKSKLIAKIYQDNKHQKLFLLLAAGLCALGALSLGSETVLADEIDSEVAAIKAIGKKQLLLEGVKHRLAMASKSQRLLFLDEMKALMDEFGTPEGEILQADEINITDKFTNAGYLLAEGLPIDSVISQTWGCPEGSPEHRAMKQKFVSWQGDEELEEEITPDFRSQFPKTMDAASWKAINKALNEGASKEDIIADVLGCKGAQFEIGEAYLNHLEKWFGVKP
ncbi:hypothetical protein [Microseira sp. BLCC-F43]|jgi:hypothetical protein|uniref:hypothetical protein n=1 Tax=Microseira sp. BLCC-F43 TaxID=3153602 RepID=UPI0035BAA549